MGAWGVLGVAVGVAPRGDAAVGEGGDGAVLALGVGGLRSEGARAVQGALAGRL